MYHMYIRTPYHRRPRAPGSAGAGTFDVWLGRGLATDTDWLKLATVGLMAKG